MISSFKIAEIILINRSDSPNLNSFDLLFKILIKIHIFKIMYLE